MAQHIHFNQLSAQAWKNGGGSTTEMAVSPPGAGFDGFDWRISVATVAVDGPFSVFPGIDRTLTLLSGAGMALEMGGNTAPEQTSGQVSEQTSEQANKQIVTLCPDQPDWAFAGELSIFARLLDGVTIDFNVMTRRSRCQHQVLRHVVADGGQVPIRRQSAWSLLFVAALDEHAHCQVSAAVDEMDQANSSTFNTFNTFNTFELRRYDALLLDESDATLWHSTPTTGRSGEPCQHMTLLQVDISGGVQ